MPIKNIPIQMNGGSSQPLKDVYSDIVQIRRVDKAGNATAVRKDNSRVTFKVDPALAWIANNPM